MSNGIRRGGLWLGLVLLTAGCVSQGKYDELAAERDALAEQRAELERERDSLADRAATLDEEVAAARVSEEKAALRLEEATATYQGLVGELEEELAAGTIQIQQLKDGITLNVSQDVLFETGSATLDESGLDVIERVSERIAETEYRVEVEGHTADVPIGKSLRARYPSNWELAGARASSVVRVLQDRGIGGDRLVAVSYGENAPLAPNDSDAGRQANRRIEIRLLPIPPEERLPAVASPPAPPDADATGDAEAMEGDRS